MTAAVGLQETLGLRDCVGLCEGELVAFGSFGGAGTDSLFMLKHITFKLLLPIKLPTNNFSWGSTDCLKGKRHRTRGCTYAKVLEWGGV